MEQYGVCTSRSVRTVSLVVTAVDDFTGLVITGSNVRVWIDGAKPPIKKQDGYHVFMDLLTGEHTVLAEGSFYNRCSFVCRVEDGSYTNLKLRLTPGRNAPLEAGTAVIEGSAPAGSADMGTSACTPPYSCPVTATSRSALHALPLR